MPVLVLYVFVSLMSQSLIACCLPMYIERQPHHRHCHHQLGHNIETTYTCSETEARTNLIGHMWGDKGTWCGTVLLHLLRRNMFVTYHVNGPGTTMTKKNCAAAACLPASVGLFTLLLNKSVSNSGFTFLRHQPPPPLDDRCTAGH